LFVALSLTAPYFLTLENLLNVMQQAAFIGIIAFAMTLVIICAEIDISVGSAVALSSALLGVLTVSVGLPLPVAALIVLAEATIVGLGAGFVRAQWGAPSFIVTLALWSGLRGVATFITNAYPIPLDYPAFVWWGGGNVFGIPVTAILMLVAFGVMWAIATRTTFGRSVYAVGGNAQASLLSGINVRMIRIAVFGITGCMAGITGVLLSARLAAANANLGVGLEFQVISAVVVGGTSLYGGRGTMTGTLMGVLFIGLVSDGMVLEGVNPYLQSVVYGVVILGAVLLSLAQQRRPAV
jgi:simple sugar transport system permease protein